jgi:hypothetical protein
MLAAILRFMPKIGPFRKLTFNVPTSQTEDLYVQSINTTVDQYQTLLAEVGSDRLALPDYDLDSGQPTKAAEYSLADETYAQLLTQLSEHKFDQTSPQLRDNILEFYSNLSAPIVTKKDRARWQKVLAALDDLKSATPIPTRKEEVGVQ